MFLSAKSPERITIELSFIFYTIGSILEGGIPENSNFLK
jgi:hypothetical protein